ncbi:PfaD family polyunsaturated fatty acid/polyketide biosynthesis protein [Streptomyces sp. AV19]|uniref:PfaD family polyunsaturated fatty acid/polyketide biosynthesis protein n=1 Tax=Streptomyces sp. AV19 TaxID=2793068 RepID=UPI0018FEA8C8|nr:PfaD family polyunsaturated fatty acid/polyketide biosynthesis protein [Streptomyces sp. AV19]MBH1933291.1 PfaD family polyunsaturated fatty acid/polyketide biosynthesis protein [Streptomyces sp. AV19]MDG4536182.1 PfaD family polyunsaturated fatty acid/polyketide biosynthesis protein [Streptomyces sp. AV19]
MTAAGHDLHAALSALDRPCYVIRTGTRTGVSHDPPPPGAALLAAAGPLPPERLGAPGFPRAHGVRRPYMAGAMAGGIAGPRLVAALSRAGYLAAFGAAGLPGDRIDDALAALRRELGDHAPFACNLLHAPMAPHLERTCVDLCLKHHVTCVEASAFVQLTPDLVRYRLTGLRPDPATGVHAGHRVVAKVSREETAALFLRPAPEPLVALLLRDGRISDRQALLARSVPMADALTAEADSGGHTDRRPLTVLLPALARLRDRLLRAYDRPPVVHLGAAGGLGCPHAVAAAFALGADYVVTGSVNQATVEADTAPGVKRLLAGAGVADCVMAPAADMFEQGVQVQVLGRGTMFPVHAARLYRLYRDHESLEALPAAELRRLEERVLRRPLPEVWRDTAAYLAEHDPDQLARAERDPRHRMALSFRWYLGMSSRWATAGDTGRAADWQVWCGPAMGAFNRWTAGTALAAPENRHAAVVADHLLRGAAYRTRVAHLTAHGVRIPASCADHRLPDAGENRLDSDTGHHSRSFP